MTDLVVNGLQTVQKRSSGSERTFAYSMQTQVRSKGQVLIEYLLVTFILVIALAGTSKLFNNALKKYYNRVATVICSPAP